MDTWKVLLWVGQELEANGFVAKAVAPCDLNGPGGKLLEVVDPGHTCANNAGWVCSHETNRHRVKQNPPTRSECGIQDKEVGWWDFEESLVMMERTLCWRAIASISFHVSNESPPRIV